MSRTRSFWAFGLAGLLWACGAEEAVSEAPRADAVAPSADSGTAPPPDARPSPPTDAPTTPPTDAPTAPPTDAPTTPPTTPPTDAPTTPPTTPPTAPPTQPPAPEEDPTDRVFDPTVLHVVELEVDERHLEALEYDRENRIPCDVVFDGVRLPNAGVRQKGGIGSVSGLGGKPGFSLRFDEFEDDQTLFGLERLRLNNAIQDASFLHEHLGYDVARRMGLPAARTAHAVVTLNGFVYGIYVLAESIDDEFLKRWFGRFDDDGNLYEGPCCADFVYDIDHMALKDEDEGRTREDLIAFAALVRDTPDERFIEVMTANLDLRRFILGYALDAAFLHWDGYAYNVNNHYIYRRPSDSRFVFMPHGMDQLFGDLYFDPLAWPNGRLAQRIRELPELDLRFREALMHLATDLWDVERASARMDAVRRVLATAPLQEPNVARDVRSFEDNLPGTLDYWARRKGVLLAALGPREPPPPPADPVCGNGQREDGEGCDDGNLEPGDACNPDCTPPPCFPVERPDFLGWVCPEPLDAPTAQGRCVELGGSLVTPESGPEQRALALLALELIGGETWLGLNDTEEEGVWRRADGSVAEFLAWADGRPNGGEAQNCVVLDPGLEGGWNDRECFEARPGICRPGP